MRISVLSAILGVILLCSVQSQAGVDLYGGLLVGNTSMDETQGGNSFKHSSSFFIGHFGFATGVRLKFDFDVFSLGVVGELAWNGDSFDRKQASVVNDSVYRFESYRLLSGVTTGLKFGPFALMGEYYPWVQNTVTYSDNKAENPYTKNDKLKATGFGLGFNYHLASALGYSVLFRRLTYKDVEMNGVAVTLPSAQYSPLVADDILVSLVFGF